MGLNAKITIEPRTFEFKQPAGTSRGVYTTRNSIYVRLSDLDDPNHQGIGECAPLPDLSCDSICNVPAYCTILREMCDIVVESGELPYDLLKKYPSICFGLETALLNYKRHTTALFDTPFAKGEEGIPINGLIWMGSFEEMSARLEDKLKQGFGCIKIKIGAIDFDKELDLIKRVRESFPKDKVELRVDANCAFSTNEALDKLEALSKYDIHSCEQPIRVKQYAELAEICRLSPIPIALDEELIGVYSDDDKMRLLDTVKPQYIVIKPTLHGGMRGTAEWISLAKERNIGSWITSALESNIGLNAIAQLTARLYGPNITMPQGLGTGQLFVNNTPMPLEIRGDKLYYEQKN